MKYLLLVAVLPCIVLAAEVKPNIFCPDGVECRFGQSCCKLRNGQPGCCDLPKEDLLNKRMIPALAPSATSTNVSMAVSRYCYGTQCGTNCIPNIVNGVCCPNLMYACPSGARCCSNSYAQVPWCCTKRQRCSTMYGYCLGGATSTSIAVTSVLLAFILGLMSKHLL